MRNLKTWNAHPSPGKETDVIFKNLLIYFLKHTSDKIVAHLNCNDFNVERLTKLHFSLCAPGNKNELLHFFAYQVQDTALIPQNFLKQNQQGF